MKRVYRVVISNEESPRSTYEIYLVVSVSAENAAKKAISMARKTWKDVRLFAKSIEVVDGELVE